LIFVWGLFNIGVMVIGFHSPSTGDDVGLCFYFFLFLVFVGREGGCFNIGIARRLKVEKLLHM
jgi:hypothetical protein